jgi:hypothetical protein
MRQKDEPDKPSDMRFSRMALAADSAVARCAALGKLACECSAGVPVRIDEEGHFRGRAALDSIGKYNHQVGKKKEDQQKSAAGLFQERYAKHLAACDDKAVSAVFGKDAPKVSPKPAQLAAGVREEKEHTSKRRIARRIAMDHLKEDPQYYTKLKKVMGFARSV